MSEGIRFRRQLNLIRSLKARPNPQPGNGIELPQSKQKQQFNFNGLGEKFVVATAPRECDATCISFPIYSVD